AMYSLSPFFALRRSTDSPKRFSINNS
ncbi:hypothetical protein ECEC1869_2962, partial [Escherichia coli EC1869]